MTARMDQRCRIGRDPENIMISAIIATAQKTSIQVVEYPVSVQMFDAVAKYSHRQGRCLLHSQRAHQVSFQISFR